MPDRKFSSYIWLHHPKLQIGAHARDFLSRLILVADDHGSHPAQPIILRHSCYPAELGIRVSDVSSWLKKAQATGALAIFEMPTGPVLKIAEDIWKNLVLFPNSRVGRSKFLAHEQGELPLPESGRENITPIWGTCTGTATNANTCTPAEPAQRPAEAKAPQSAHKHGSSERKGKHDKTTRTARTAEAAIEEARQAEALGQSYEEIEIIKMLGFMEWGTNEGMWRLRMKENLPALMRVVRDWKSMTPEQQHDKKNRGAWATEQFFEYSPQSRPENRKKA